MTDLDQSVLESLDGTDKRLFPYLPELLQDLDDLGADPTLIAALLSEGAVLPELARVLDLGCGKGSVSLHLLQQHPWTALGLDGLRAFTDRARERANALGLADRCRFEVEDIRTWKGEGRFDLIVLGAVGPVLGDTETTLRRLDAWLAPRGVVVLDEVYVLDGTSSRNQTYNQPRGELLASIERAGFRLLAEGHASENGSVDNHLVMFGAIRARAEALSERCPEHRALFEAYVADQAREFEILEEVVDVTLSLTRG
jgi:SAM-dependent methyltransferase